MIFRVEKVDVLGWNKSRVKEVIGGYILVYIFDREGLALRPLMLHWLVLSYP